MNKVLEYIIRAKDATARGLSSASGRLRNFAKVVGTNLMNIQAGFSMAMQVIGAVGKFIARTIQESFKFEKALVNFKTLLGSIDNAKAHVEELKKFASETPLTFDDLSSASRLLLSFGSNVNDIMPSLKMLGDIALGDSQRFQGLALVFAQVKSQGKLMGQDLLQMINQGFNPLTIISQETGVAMSELKDMMSEGAITFEMVEAAMKKVTSEGGIFHNALKDASQTGEGLTSTLKDKLNESLRQIGDTFAETAKGGMTDFINKLDELNRNGTIQHWAEGAVNAIQGVGYALYGVNKGLKWVLDKSGISDAVSAIDGTLVGIVSAATAGLGGGGWAGAAEAFDERLFHFVSTYGYYHKDWANKKRWENITAGARYNPMLTNTEDALRAQGWEKSEPQYNWIGDSLVHTHNVWRRGDEEKIMPEASTEAEQKAAREAEALKEEQIKAEEEAYEKERTLQEMMAEAKAKEEEKIAAKKAEAEKKAAEAAERARAKAEAAAERERKKAEEAAIRQAEREAEAKRILLEKLEQEREAAEERLHQKNLTRLRDELAVAEGKEGDAHGRLLEARNRLSQAWGWYRDPSSMQAYIDEHMAQQAAEVQFEKDFIKLKDKYRDWSSIEMGKLSAHDEAVRQVALAKEAEAQAKKDLAAIAKNTQDLAVKLDELMSLKDGAA